METNDELKVINIKNRTFYYFNDIIKIENFNLHNILTREKLYKKYFSLEHFIQNFD